MAVSTAQKVDYLLKKIGYTASKTGLAPDSVLTGTKKQPFAEAVPSPLIIASSCLWADSAYIPSTPPGTDSDYVKVYLSAASGHRMTADSSVAGSRAFIAYTTYNNTSTAILGDWIDTQFGASYIIKVYKGDPNSGGVALSAEGSGSNDGWFFDYSSGILNFNDTNVPSGVTDTNIYVVGYRYIGNKGASPAGGISTFTTQYVSGVSTFGGAADFDGGADISGGVGLNVVGHTEVDNVNVSGVSTFAGAVDINGGANLSGGSGVTVAAHLVANSLGVTGVATFAAAIDANSGASITGGEATFSSATVSDLTPGRLTFAGTGGALEDTTKLTFLTDKLSVTGGLTVSAGATLSSNLDVDGGADISGGVGLNVVGHTEVDNVNVSGVSTYGGAADFNSGADISGGVGLNVVGHTEVDNFNASGVSTFAALVDGNAGANFSGAETTLSSATVSDLTSGRLTYAGASGSLQDSGNLTFSGSKLTVTGNAQVTTDLDVDGGADISGGVGLNVVGHTELDEVNVSGVSTFAGLVDGNAGANFSGAETTLSSATVSDLTNNRVVLAGTAGSLEDSSSITFDGSTFAIVGGATFTGNVTVGGTLTSEDKTNVDSVGLITARTGVRITSGGLIVSAGVNTFTDAIDANGGANIAGGFVANSAKVSDLTSGRVVVAGTDGELEDASTFTFSGGTVTATNFSGNLTGTLQTAAQPNVTSLGTIASLVASTAKVSDLTATRVVLAGTAGELEDNSKLTFTTDKLAITGGITVSAGATLSSNLNVDGGADISGGVGLNVVGHTELDNLNVSGVSTFAAAIDANAGADISGGVGLNVVGHTELDNVNVSGVSTFAAAIDANAGAHISGGIGLEVVGHTEVDNFSASGVSTFAALVDGNAGANFSGAETVLSSATVSDLTENRVVIAGVDGALEDASTLTYNGTQFNVGTGITMYQATGIVSATYYYGDGSTLTNAGSTLEAASAVQRVVTTSLTSGTMTSAGTDADLTFDTSSNTLNTGKINVAGVSTFGGLIDGNAGATITGAETTLSSATVSDLTNDRVVIAGASGALEDSGNLTFDGTTLTVTGNASVTTDLNVDGGADISGGVGLNVVGHTELDNVNVSGVSTFTGAIDANSTLDVQNLATFGPVGVADSIFHEGDTNTAIRFPGADTFTVETGGSEAIRVDSSQRLLVGHTASRDVFQENGLQVSGADGNDGGVSIYTTGSGVAGANLNIAHSRGGGALNDGDILGNITFIGHDGTDLNSRAAIIRSIMTANATDDSLYADLFFATKRNAGGYPDETLRLDSAGNMGLGITPDTQGATVDSLQIGSATNLYNETSDDYTVLGNNVYFDGSDNKYIKAQESSRLMQNAGEFTFQQAGSGSADATITYTTPLKIDSTGRLMLGTTTEGHASADNLTVATSGDTGITIRSGTSNEGNIFFSDGTSGGAEYQGIIRFDHSDNGLKFNTTGSERLHLTTTGAKVTGILTATGTTSTLGNIVLTNSAVGTGATVGSNDAGITTYYGDGSKLTGTGSDSGGTQRVEVVNTGVILVGVITATDQFSGQITGVGATFTNITGTLQTAAQTNITSLGTLTGLTISGDESIADKIIHTGDTDTAIRFPTDDTVSVETAGSERLRITAGGQVRIANTTEAASSSADDLVVGTTSGNRGISIISGTSNTGNLYFGDTDTSGTGNRMGTITYGHDGNYMRFSTNGNAEKVRITKDGEVGIGITNPEIFNGGANQLVIQDSGSCGMTIDATSTSNCSIFFADGADGNEAYRGWVQYEHTNDALTLGTAAGERVRITSAGKIGIGSADPVGVVDIVAADPVLTIRDTDTGLATANATVRLGESTSGPVLDNYYDIKTGKADTSASNFSFAIVSSRSDNVPFYIEPTVGKVGINTTVPTAQLEVKGDLDIKEGKLDVYGSALGGTAGDDIDLAVFRSTNGNASLLEIYEERDTTGADWNSAFTRIQKKIDSVDMGYIQFNGTDNTYGIEMGTNGDEKFLFAERNSAVTLYHDNLAKIATSATGVTITGGMSVTGASPVSFGSTTVSQLVLKDYTETVKVIGDTGTSATLNMADGNVFTATLTGNCTFTFTTSVNAYPNMQSFSLILANDTTPSRTISWPASVKWPNNSVPSRTTTASRTDIWSFMSPDNGTTWYGNIALYNFT